MKSVFLLTFIFIHLTCSKIVKKHIENSVCPDYTDIPTYDLTNWVDRLNLQVCTIVEIGDLNTAIFIEDRPNKLDNMSEQKNYFLGICDVETLTTWQLCGPDLKMERPNDCFIDVLDFRTTTSSARVHRRLCDINRIARTQSRCKCESTISGYELFCVTGFPTCFFDPLPMSLCEHYSACGFGRCKASTLFNRIHILQCGPHCIGGQPFCEYPVGAATSKYPEVKSFWTEWEDEVYIELLSNSMMIRSRATCINKNTGKGAVDCLGPGTNCCPPQYMNCSCHNYIEDQIMYVYRTYNAPGRRNDSDSFLEIYDNREFKKLQKKIAKGHMRHMRDEYASLVSEDSISDDDDEEDSLGDEDIEIDESEDVEPTVATTEELESDEQKAQQETDILKSPKPLGSTNEPKGEALSTPQPQRGEPRLEETPILLPSGGLASDLVTEADSVKKSGSGGSVLPKYIFISKFYLFLSAICLLRLL